MRENVWDYPRPPRAEATDRRLRVELGGVALASTRRAIRVLETSHPPVYYIPPDDVPMQHLVRRERTSFCEWKGAARYFDVVVGERRVVDAAWSYPAPASAFEALRDHVAFYPSRMDACFVDGERVEAQSGDFYGGWITRDLVGPFKGGPGTLGW